jgi:EAL domain-containing protein (putative c-di-GMP-specific phosphodiesterase class I)
MVALSRQRRIWGVPLPVLILAASVTEPVAVEDYAALTDGLDALRFRGVRLAVDDAGSGFSSLPHILNLKPDIITLDRTLVDAIDSDPRPPCTGGVPAGVRQSGRSRGHRRGDREPA